MRRTSATHWRGLLHHIDGSQLFASHGDAVLTGSASDGPVNILARLPLGPWRKACAKVRPLGRLLRQHIYHVTPFGDRVIVMGFDHIWCLDMATGRLLAPPTRIAGGRPLALCAAPHGLYYGEYRSNPERNPIRLFFSPDGLCWTVVRQFEGIRHIHGVYHDRFTDSLWVTTGDADAESAIWRSTDRFATVAAVHSGSQQARAIGLIFTEQHVYFGSDTPFETNFIYRLDRASGQVDRLTAVSGSVFHGSRAGNYLLFSTAVEPSQANDTKESTLYASADGENWKILARHRKDNWPMRYFQYGQLPLPAGDNLAHRYWYSTFAVVQDNCIRSGKLDDE
jgi:hypothetical protein